MTRLAETLRVLSSQPRRVFLLDGLGALVSTLALVAVVIPLQPYFGLPRDLLWKFASVAAVFSAYSLTCAQVLRENFRPFMAVIALSNSVYSLATMGSLYSHRVAVTPLCVLYFMLEVMIVAALVSLEIRTIRRVSPRV